MTCSSVIFFVQSTTNVSGLAARTDPTIRGATFENIDEVNKYIDILI